MLEHKEPREFVAELEKDMQCNCDLDNWVPRKTTGHSWVCRIHKTAMTLSQQSKGLGT